MRGVLVLVFVSLALISGGVFVGGVAAEGEVSGDEIGLDGNESVTPVPGGMVYVVDYDISGDTVRIDLYSEASTDVLLSDMTSSSSSAGVVSVDQRRETLPADRVVSFDVRVDDTQNPAVMVGTVRGAVRIHPDDHSQLPSVDADVAELVAAGSAGFISTSAAIGWVAFKRKLQETQEVVQYV